MALFSKKTKEEKIAKVTEAVKVVKTEKSSKVVNKAKVFGNSKVNTSENKFARVLRNPRITEKATNSAEKGVYVFEVDPRANKTAVKGAIQELYKVVPVKINITKIPRKKVFSRGHTGFKPGGKKAIVYLKKGDSIEIV